GADLVDRRVGHVHLVADDVAGDPWLPHLAGARGLVARLDRVARRRDRSAARERLHRGGHGRAPPRVLARPLTRLHGRRLDGERELRAIGRGTHLALAAHGDRSPLDGSVLRESETRRHDEEPAERLHHPDPRSDGTSRRQTRDGERATRHYARVASITLSGVSVRTIRASAKPASRRSVRYSAAVRSWPPVSTSMFRSARRMLCVSALRSIRSGTIRSRSR